MGNHLFEFTMKVMRAEGCELPAGMAGAYIPTYAGAPDFQEAIRRGVNAISSMHYTFKAIEGEVRQIPVESWDDYIKKVWPDLASHFPSAVELVRLVKDGAVFFGPIAGFNGKES